MSTCGGRAVLAWVLTRSATVAVFMTSERSVASDVKYYWVNLTALFHGTSAAHTLREYPLPGIATMLVQFGVTYGHRSLFEVVFVGSMLLVDGAFACVLWRRSSVRSRSAVWFWVAFVPLLGPTALFRFDLVPSVLAALALLLLVSRPRVAGVVLGVATAVKGRPFLVLASLAHPRSSRRAVLSGFGVVAVVALVATALAGGISRVVSPLTWQSDRGLQIESLVSTPLMLARRVTDGHRWPISMKYYAWQLEGPGVHALLLASNVLQIIAAAVLLTLYFRAYQSGASTDSRTLAWLALASVLVFVAVNKTLSPQYLPWIAALVAVVLLVDPSLAARRIAGVMLAVVAASHLVFPWLYGRIMAGTDPSGVGVALLVLRNAAVLAMTIVATRIAFGSMGESRVGISERPDASQPESRP